MRGRYFRNLFENLDGGLFHSGSIYDKEENKTINFMYMIGSHCRNIRTKEGKKMNYDMDAIPQRIDILVVGGYTIKYIKKLTQIVRKHQIETAILPYITPIQRLVLVDGIRDEDDMDKEVIHFLEDPYLFLKECGIEHIFFLYRNGTVIAGELEELVPGCHFELADMESLQLIREMEGYSIPVVRAGYIVKSDWLFYFGVYGLDIQILSNFTRKYFSQSGNTNDETDNHLRAKHMTHLLKEYLKKFGSSPATTIVMYEGPLNAFSDENNSLLTEKEFSRQERCEAWLSYQYNDCGTCAIGCMHNKDHDIIKNNQDDTEPRYGTLLLGNVNLNCYLSEVITRFWKVRLRIRGIVIPNFGSAEDWTDQILNFPMSKERIYWICGKYDITSSGVVSDIALSASYNRFLMLDEDHGCCISGYLLAKEDME